MIINNGDEKYHAHEGNSYFASYDNDLMDGFFIDLEENYLFISKHTPHYRLVEQPARDEGMLSIHDSDIDLTEKPHLWIVSALGRTIVASAEFMANNPDYEPEACVVEGLPEQKPYDRLAELSRLVTDPDVGGWLKGQYWKEIDELLDERNKNERAV